MSTSELAMIPVHARPNPMSMEVVHAEFEAGLSIAEILGAEAVCCRVEIGGMTIPEEWWAHIRPKPGIAVVITRYPQGGGFKNVLRIVAFAALAIGVAAISLGAGAGLFAAVGLGSVPAGVLAAGFGVVGSLAINALIPPQNPAAPSVGAGDTTNLLKSITGTSNQINRYGVIPCIVGTVKYYPPYAALPYTELSGDDQYLRCLFDLGSGDPQISDMRIGDTDLANYTDVQTEIGTNPGLFSQDITESAAGNALNNDGSTATRTSSANTDELSIDLSFASGLFGVDDNGNTVGVTCTLKVEYSPMGAGSWTALYPNTNHLTISTPAARVQNDGTITVYNGERKAIRIGLRWPVTNGQYDVRVTRVNTNWGSSDPTARAGDLTWTVIRSIRYSTVSSTGTKKIALRIKATDQLSGNIDQFNCILSQPISVWHSDTQTWVTQLSNNPAFVFRWLLKECPANPRKVTNVDDDEIIAWSAECDQKEFCYSNAFDQPTTLYAMLKDIAAAGRASFNIRNGLYGVVRDVNQTSPIQMFTPRNSWGFSGARAFPDEVHALRVQFLNEEANFQQDERIVYDAGYGDNEMVLLDPALKLATKFEQMTISGCTNADAAWRLGRYHLAVSRLRPNTYSWYADVENLACSRGNLVGFANDVIGAGIAQGRIKEITLLDPDAPFSPISRIVFDERVTLASGMRYGVRIRKQNGGVVFTEVTPDAYGVETSSLNLTTPPTEVAPGDLVLFGVLDNDSIPLVITKIEPGADLSAKITAVDAAFAVLNADSGTPPEWISQITGQPWLDAPNPPDLLLIDSSQLLSNPNDAGNGSPVIVVKPAGKPGLQPIDHVDVRYRRADTVGAWTTISVPYGQDAYITGVQRRMTYQIEARNVGKNGAASVWVQQSHVVADASVAPLAPFALAALSVADGVHLNWSLPGKQRADVEYSIERTDDASGSPNGSHWATIANVKATSFTDGVTDGIVRWYRVRAVDFQGLASAYSNNVNSNNKSVADGADNTAENIPIELLTNGSFERGIIGWTRNAAPATIDTSQRRYGTQCLKTRGGYTAQQVPLYAGHTYLLQGWVMTDGSVVGGGSQGAGLAVYDPLLKVSIQKANGVIVGVGEASPGVLLQATSATPWTLLQMTFSVAQDYSYAISVTDDYGSSAQNANAWFDGISLTDVTGGADVTSAQPIVYAGFSNNLIPNSDFLLGNTKGWLLGGNANFSSGSIQLPGNPSVAYSPTFAIQPGNKYRMNFITGKTAEGDATYFRVFWTSQYHPNITDANYSGYFDFAGNAGIEWPLTEHVYEWTAPAGARYASLVMYNVGGGNTYLRQLIAQDYSAAAQWGADITGQNTSNNTNNVGSTPAGTVASVIPAGNRLYLNSGSRSYSVTSI